MVPSRPRRRLRPVSDHQSARRRYAYLGPAGTFTDTALDRVIDGHGTAGVAVVERLPLGTVGAALAAVRSGAADAAVVPIENSVEGGVSATLDDLAEGADGLVIIGEEVVAVRFVLAAPAGVGLAGVSRIATHAHAQAQCRGWLASTLPGAVVLPALSTAAAAAGLSEAGARASRADTGVGYDAAICAPAAAAHYGLTVLADDIGDRAGHTRFVVVARRGTLPPPTGADRTTVVAYLRENRSGSLLELLEQFAVRGVDLTRIESRPTGTAIGEYCFSIDLAGHVAEPRVAEALKGLRRLSPHTRFLGSYPRADAEATRVPDWTTTESFTVANDWLDGLTGGDDPVPSVSGAGHAPRPTPAVR